MAEDSDDPFAKYTKRSKADNDDPFAKYVTGDDSGVRKPGVLESVGRGAVEGATFGFDDKLGMDKAAREASRKANPWAHFAGELIGGALPMAAAAVLPSGVGQAATAGRAAQLTGRGINLVRGALAPTGEINTWGRAAGQGAKLGASYGTLTGAGHADVSDDDTLAEGLGKRAVGAVKGAAIGTALGAPLGLAGHGVYRGAQELGSMVNRATAETAPGSGGLVTATRALERDRITPQEIIDNIRSEFPDATQTAPGGPGAPLNQRFWGPLNNKQPITADQVEETVKRAMQGEGASDISAALKAQHPQGQGPGPSAVQTLLDELAERHLGPLNLVDRAAMARRGAGDNTQMSMRAAAATPGEHVGIARENLLERQLGAQGRLGQLLDRTLGSADYEGVAAKHASDLQSAGNRAYSTAYATETPFDLNPIFNKWEAKFGNMAGPIPKAVMGALNELRTSQPVLDQAGNLVKDAGIVNRAPPMNLEGFIYARQGLSDAIQQAQQSGNKNLARNLTQLHEDLTNEVARTNPAWKTANDLWRDGKAAQEAMEAGARMTTRLNAGSRENLSEFTSAQQDGAQAAKALREANKPVNAALKKDPNYQPTPKQQAAIDTAQAQSDAANSRQELFKVGLVRALSDMLSNQGETHNLTKQLLLPGAQKMLRQVLGKEADQFFNALRAEQAMHRTYSSQFGSQTTPLAEAVKDQTWAPRVEASMMNPLTWINPALRLAHEYAARNINNRRNVDLMRLYTETDPLRQLEALRAMQAQHQIRSDWGNRAGRPAIGAASGVLPEAEIATELAPGQRRR